MNSRWILRFGCGAVALLFLVGCTSQSVRNDPPQSAVQSESRSMGTVTEPIAFERAQVPLPTLGENPSLEDYLRHAQLNNPGLESAFQRWRAAIERLPQARALPDPRLTFGHFIEEVETRVGAQEYQIGFSQTFPWFGKLGDREEAATREANALHQRLEGVRAELLFRVESAFNELFFLKRSIDITAENTELLRQFERIARERYRVAAADHADVIRLQVELGKLEDRLRQLRDLRKPYQARMNAALNRPSGSEVPWPSAVRPDTIDEGIDELSGILEQNNPHLLALQEETREERIRAEIARKDGLPDFTLGLAYTAIDGRSGVALSDNGDDALLASVSLNLPIWRGRYNAGVREAIAKRSELASLRIETTNRLNADLEQAFFDHQDARRRVELYRDMLIPRTTESLQASLGGFAQGTADFLDLVDTERTLLEFRLGLARAIVDRATSYARVERLIGTSLHHGREENR